MATMPLSEKQLKGSGFLTARKGDDVAFITDDAGWWGEYPTWIKRRQGNQLAWYVDRRSPDVPARRGGPPQGLLRSIDHGEGGDIGGVSGMVNTVNYVVRDSMNNEIAKGSTKVNAAGGFDTAFTLPKTPNLGYANIELKASGKHAGETGHGFQIQEFRRPEFEVSATASQGPMIVGGTADVTVDAKYYAGGGLPGAPVTWYISQSQTTYTPPNRDEYIFGQWQPWWGYRELVERGRQQLQRAQVVVPRRQDRRHRRATSCTWTSSRSIPRCRCRSPPRRPSWTSTARRGPPPPR